VSVLSSRAIKGRRWLERWAGSTQWRGGPIRQDRTEPAATASWHAAFVYKQRIRETKNELGENQYSPDRVANNLPPKLTTERITEQFNVSDQTVKNAFRTVAVTRLSPARLTADIPTKDPDLFERIEAVKPTIRGRTEKVIRPSR